MATAPNLTVGYWSIRGLAAPLRMMCMFKRIPFRAECYDLKVKPEGGYDGSEWFSKKPALKEKNPLMNLPYIIDGDVVVSQSNACLIYLGRKYGMWGATEAEVMQCEQLLCEIMDLRNKMTDYVYDLAAADPAAGAKALLDAAVGPNSSLAKLELWLAANPGGSGTFLVASHATAPDFHLWELLDQYLLLASTHGLPSPLAKFPLLAAFHAQFAALPENARYLASPLHRMPINNLMAVFGSAPGGATFKAGQAIDWQGLSGEY